MAIPGDVNRRVMVTGAAGGLGQEIATQLAARGCALGLVDIDGPGTGRVAAACRTCGADVEEIVGDFTEAGAPEAAVERMVQRFGGLDVLVNNAGYGAIEPFLGMTHRLWQRTLNLNVVALAMACAAAGRVMQTQRSGRIVNITSPASRMALPDYLAYAASKAAVDSITRAAAACLAPHGVLVNSLAPGMMDTEMQRSTEADLARLAGRDDFQAFLDERTRRVPLGRRAEIAEIAAAVVWLCLDAPPYMTAERLNMSGGMDKD
ncbi:MAG TPA: SDR family oxidoreductase [Acetobacteraceae bacterium]|nr:SDR family oxidoreductase [Acetobacteraceae bacterium]